MDTRLIHTPEGVRDIYGEELKAKKELTARIREVFDSYGYSEIQTPVFEFFDVFSNEVGTTPSKDLFKLFDKEGNTLVLRPDFTPSVARCAVKYFLEDKANVPLKLCYEGNVFTNTSELKGLLKETTQTGAELIGDDSAEADAQILIMVIKALKAAGLDSFTVSTGEIGFFKGICEAAGLDDETVMKLRDLISVKNYYGAAALLKENGGGDRDTELLLKNGDVCTIADLRAAKEKLGNKRSADALERLDSVYTLVEKEGLESYLSFDLGLLSKFNSYTGMLFKAYTYGAGDAIAKGGRYDGLLAHFGHHAPAVGCVFLVDDILFKLRR